LSGPECHLNKEKCCRFKYQKCQNHPDCEGGTLSKKVVTGCRNGKCKIEERKNDIVLKYEPNHPDANENGYVAYPDIDVSEEMEKMIKAAQAKTLILENLPEKSESLLVGKKFAECFKNYELVKHEIDYQTYLGR
jgi:hypothetical protein